MPVIVTVLVVGTLIGVYCYIEHLKEVNYNLLRTLKSIKPNVLEETYATYYAMLFLKCRRSYTDYRLAFGELGKMYVAMIAKLPEEKQFHDVQEIEASFKIAGILHDYSIDGKLNYVPIKHIGKLEKFIKATKNRLADELTGV